MEWSRYAYIASKMRLPTQAQACFHRIQKYTAPIFKTENKTNIQLKIEVLH